MYQSNLTAAGLRAMPNTQFPALGITQTTTTTTVTQTILKTRQLATAAPTMRAAAAQFQPTSANIINRMVGNLTAETCTLRPTSAHIRNAAQIFTIPTELQEMIPAFKWILAGAVLGAGIYGTATHLYRRLRPAPPPPPTPTPIPPGEDAKTWKAKVQLARFLLNKAAEINSDLRDSVQNAQSRNEALQALLNRQGVTDVYSRSGNIIERAERQAWIDASPSTLRSSISRLSQTSGRGHDTPPSADFLRFLDEEAQEESEKIVDELCLGETGRCISRSLEIYGSNRNGRQPSIARKRGSDELDSEDEGHSENFADGEGSLDGEGSVDGESSVDGQNSVDSEDDVDGESSLDSEDEAHSEDEVHIVETIEISDDSDASDATTPRPLSNNAQGTGSVQDESQDDMEDANGDDEDEHEEMSMITPDANLMDSIWRQRNCTPEVSSVSSNSNSSSSSETTPVPTIDLNDIPELRGFMAMQDTGRPAKRARKDDGATSVSTVGSSRSRRSVSVTPVTPVRRSSRLERMGTPRSMNVRELSRRSASPRKGR